MPWPWFSHYHSTRTVHGYRPGLGMMLLAALVPRAGRPRAVIKRAGRVRHHRGDQPAARVPFECWWCVDGRVRLFSKSRHGWRVVCVEAPRTTPSKRTAVPRGAGPRIRMGCFSTHSTCAPPPSQRIGCSVETSVETVALFDHAPSPHSIRSSRSCTVPQNARISQG